MAFIDSCGGRLGRPGQGFDAPGTAYQYEDAWTMHPYAGVEVQQTMFATAPTLAFQAQIPGQMPMVQY